MVMNKIDFTLENRERKLYVDNMVSSW